MTLFLIGLEFTLSTTSKGNSDAFEIFGCGSRKYLQRGCTVEGVLLGYFRVNL